MKPKLIDILKKLDESDNRGKVADYIPALKKADINDLGLTVIHNNKVYSIGEWNTKFTIQSISKVIVLILALVENKEQKVFENVGYQGNNKPFDQIPHFKADNPMINAGAITLTSLIKGSSEEKIKKILELTKLLANNNDLGINKDVYLSESSTGDRNKKIALLLEDRGLLYSNVSTTLETYFKQCSIEVDTLDIANIMNNILLGFNNLNLKSKTDKKQIKKIVLGVMTSAGMYNFSSKYLIDIGIPAKSGVSGGIMAGLKDVSIGVYSPGLDSSGNSLLGVKALREIGREFNIGLYE